MRKANMITRKPAGPIPSSVLLFSGGMDSLCLAFLEKPDVLLYVPSNSNCYGVQEDLCIRQLAEQNDFIRDRLQALSPQTLNLSPYERDDLIIPNRNAHLVLLASNYGDNIMLAAMQGDRSTDKDETFCKLMTALLDHMWSEQHWTHQRSFRITLPGKSITKTQLVSRFLLESGESSELLFTSFSCYSPTDEGKHCGICKPCARKRVALANNGIEIPNGYFAQPFWETEWWQLTFPVISRGMWRGAEDLDFLKFAKEHLDSTF